MTLFLKNNEDGRRLLARGKTRALLRLPDVLLGAGIGAVVFLLLYGPTTLDVTYDGWIYAGYIEQDIIQHYAGWMFYRQAPWTMPLAVAENLAVPYGASIVFTDSVPIVAILCKVFRGVLPATFQYFGLVVFANFMLQGVFAVLLLREFQLSRLFSGVGSLFFVLSPIFVERAFRHVALNAQWLVLAALWLYFVARHKKRLPAVGFWLLCVLTMCIHSYFTPMVYAILAATLVEDMLRNKRVLRPLLVLGACFMGNLLVSYPLGILTRGGGGESEGFGRYSMNLNALWNPTSFDWFAEGDAMGWSRLLPTFGQNYHQYDGFNYLGAGLLLGLVLLGGCGVARLVRGRAVVLRWAGGFLKSHWPLLAVCACLAVFAVSNVVVLNSTTLFTLPLPAFILRFCQIFRASGRMLWPVWYLLCLCVVVACGRLLQKHWRYVALGGLLAVQLADLSGALATKHAYFNNGRIAVENEFTSEGFVFLMERYDTVLCLGNIFDYELAAGVIRWNPDVTTNMILTNRGHYPVINAAYAADTEYLLNGGPLEPGTLYLVSDEGTFDGILQGLHPDARGYSTGHYYWFGIPAAGNPLPEVVPPSAGG